MQTKKKLATMVASGAVALGLSLVPTGADAATVVGNLYQHANYGGAVKPITAAANGFVCTGPVSDTDLTVSSLPDFNDRVSSFTGYSNCWTKIYEHNNFGGASLGYQGSTSYVGDAMNDRASSVKYS